MLILPQRSRRTFLRDTLATGLGLAAGLRAATLGGSARADTSANSQVALTYGDDRADNVFRALQTFKKEIAAAIGDKRIVVKPNFVYYSSQLCCTHVSAVEGVLEFLKSIGKRNIIVAESSANSNAMEGYDFNNYWGLVNRYPVKLMDLNQEGFGYAQIWQTKTETSPSKTIRVSGLYLNPNNFIISVAPIKSHNTAVATLTMKNVSMSAPVIDIGNFWSQKGNRSDKAWMHGASGSAPGDFQCLNDNVYRMAKVYNIHPHLGVLDGYQGMEHNGPVSGTAVTTSQKVAVAGLDFVAVDRVGVALMGSPLSTSTFLLNDQPYPACLNYAGQAGLGQWDLSKIDVLGERIADHIYNYQLYDDVSNTSNTAAYQLGLRTTPRE